MLEAPNGAEGIHLAHEELPDLIQNEIFLSVIVKRCLNPRDIQVSIPL